MLSTPLSLACTALLPLAMTAFADMPKVTYPPAKTVDVVDTLHGVTVKDPYRWLEDTESAETKAWIEAQTKLGKDYLAQLPMREVFRSRLEELWNYDKHGLPQIVKGRLFYSKKPGLTNQAIHYWREDRPGAPEKLLLDPNSLSPDGTVAVSGFVVSDNGKYVAYGLSQSGSDWQTWHVLDVETGQKLSDELKWVKFSSAGWNNDSSGFYYARYDEPKSGEALKAVNLNQKLFFHRLGTPQSDDQLVYSRPDHPQWGFDGGITEDGRYLLIDVREGAGSTNAFFYRDLKEEGSKVVELFNKFDARYSFIGNEGSTFFFVTDFKAPKSRLVAIDLAKPAESDWKTLIPQREGTLTSVTWASGKFIAQYLVDAHDEVVIFDKEGKETGKLPLANLAALSGLGAKSDAKETFYALGGYTNPGEILRYNIETGTSTSFWKPEVKFNPNDFETTQVFYKSKDGTRVSMFLSSKKGLKKDGSNPCLLYGYGGFNISLGPVFSPSYVAWMEQGGVYAVANLRGGGEYGEDWHKAGMRTKKQNVFDDFISAAEFLISEKYTASSKLAISGGSNGGLLVGACLLQRPDLFAACGPSVGVHDMIRFPKFTIGWAWQDEYGFPEKNAEEFNYILGYSPYHNVKAGVSYPPTLISTADHDDRVFPAHSFKFGAALQAAQSGNAPILMRIESKAGHGAGTPTAKIIERVADEYAFFAKGTGMVKK